MNFKQGIFGIKELTLVTLIPHRYLGINILKINQNVKIAKGHYVSNYLLN